VTLLVAGESVAIPANMLRFADQRRGGAVEHADLVLHWPTLEGYSEALAADFMDGSPAAPIVYATLARRDTPLDAAERLEAVYRRFFVGEPLPAPTGLTARRLDGDSGFVGEIVYYGPEENGPFVARCLAQSTPEVPATCLRDIPVGRTLSLLYRFNRDLIGDWRALDTGMAAVAAIIEPAP
jgi:hypothetical protein